MERTGSRVILVKTEVEENNAGQKVNKLFDFDYPLPNLYFEDNLEEYIKGLRQRFSKHDPETEMERCTQGCQFGNYGVYMGNKHPYLVWQALCLIWQDLSVHWIDLL